MSLAQAAKPQGITLGAMDEDPPPWQVAERILNETAARDAANNERQIAQFRPVVLRADAREEDVRFYNAAIFLSTVTQMMELLRSDAAKCAKAFGQGSPPTTEPREQVLGRARSIVASARERCVRSDAAPPNVEMYERLVGWQRFGEVSERARLDTIDAARASGAGTD